MKQNLLSANYKTILISIYAKPFQFEGALKVLFKACAKANTNDICCKIYSVEYTYDDNVLSAEFVIKSNNLQSIGKTTALISRTIDRSYDYSNVTYVENKVAENYLRSTIVQEAIKNM